MSAINSDKEPNTTYRIAETVLESILKGVPSSEWAPQCQSRLTALCSADRCLRQDLWDLFLQHIEANVHRLSAEDVEIINQIGREVQLASENVC